ncbi:MAG: quinol monooxygenase YgiN [Hyphomicrobiaceae bacterium]|jgi:quinol monooxygenase YgiN
MYTVIARIRAIPGSADELASELTAMVNWVAENEPETLSYICHRSVADPDAFVFFERYTNEAAFAAHGASERFAQLIQALDGKVAAAPELEVLDEVAGKL